MPIDLTHKILSLKSQPQSFTEIASPMGFVVFNISFVISGCYGHISTNHLESLSVLGAPQGFKEKNTA